MSFLFSYHIDCCLRYVSCTFSNIGFVSFQGKNVPEALTSGKWEVVKILALDDINERVLVNDLFLLLFLHTCTFEFVQIFSSARS